MAATGIPAVMKTILYVRATAVAETIRYVRAVAVVVAETIRHVRAVAVVKAVRRVRIAVQVMCPCRTFARRRDVAVIAIVAVQGMGSMAAIMSAVMIVTIAASMRCAGAAIVAETECISRKRRHFAAFFEFWADCTVLQHGAVPF